MVFNNKLIVQDDNVDVTSNYFNRFMKYVRSSAKSEFYCTHVCPLVCYATRISCRPSNTLANVSDHGHFSSNRKINRLL